MHKANLKFWEAEGKVKVKFAEGDKFNIIIICHTDKNTI
jgi:hypothetical protein